MNFDGLFQRSQLVTEKLLTYLDANSLAYFGSCSKYMRSITNSEQLWHRLCKIKSYDKHEYLLDTETHPSIPARSTSALPTFQHVESETLEELNRWRELYNRVEHLKKNWTSGIYYVAPVLKGHTGQLSAFDSNGTIAVSGSSDDKLIKVWSLQDCECLDNIKSKSESINCLKIFNDLIITAGDDGVIFIYSIGEGSLIKTLASNKSSSGGINKFIINDHAQLIAAHSDRSIKVWSLHAFDIQFVLREHDEDIECLEFYKDFVISGSWDQSIVLWDLEYGRQLLKLTGHSEVINCVKMTGNRIISGSSDATLRIWDLIMDRNEKKKRIACLNNFRILKDGHKSDVLCLETFGDLVVSAGADSLVIVWNMAGERLHVLGGHLGNVRYIYIDEFKCITGGDAKRIMVWDYKNGKLMSQLYRNPNLLKSMWVNDTKIITTSPETNSGITIICYW